MAYGDDSLFTLAEHHLPFDNSLLDIGSGSTPLSLTNSGAAFVPTNITRDTTFSLRTATRDAVVKANTANDSGLSPLSQYSFGGWFRTTQIQGPPTLIYGQGATTGLALFLWGGNNVMLQVLSGGVIRQIYSDKIIVPNRTYHFFASYEGAGDIMFYIDGVEQSNSLDGKDAMGNLSGHNNPHRWGDNGTLIPVGSNFVTVKAVVEGLYSHWTTWTDASIGPLIFDRIFVPGAIPEIEITNTGNTLQQEIDAIANTSFGNYPLSILITGYTGDQNVNADNITFDKDSSASVYYESSSGVLNWTNTNGSNASKGLNVNFINPYTVTLTDLQDATEIRIYEAGTDNELAGIETIVGNEFSATVGFEFIDIRILSLEFLFIKLENIQIITDTTISIEQFIDRQYIT